MERPASRATLRTDAGCRPSRRITVQTASASSARRYRAGALLERLRTRLGGAAREGLLWLLGLVGFFLLADTLAHFGVID